ncbi:hypothetical protein MNQ98_01230 [Paenibacillus sp. N3/727]|uniref:hypothetical protein n=1 Tax=Paenibacillus sp. N3/727 TaxID=2925845 RepID=UPI001F53AB51|nr:hypothetical protein [Paenibacillus sp. N3/727]UNK18698.1 hypothetical protein MNQ98_01230 [Paenibacillus sp. N3/727]
MLIFLLSLLLLLTACSARSSQQTQNFGNPTAEEILKSIPDADQHGLIIVAVNNGIEIRYIGLVEG